MKLLNGEFCVSNADLKLSTGLMDKFLEFGQLGEKTFSTRTFFLKLEAGKYSALWPINFKVKSIFRINKKAKKLHFLLIAFVNNKDVFSEVGEIIVRCASPKGEHAVAPPEPHLIQKTLRYPGNVDNWMPVPISHTYDSYGKGWSSSPALSTSGATFSIITIDLGKEELVESVTIKSCGRMPAIGIAGISSEL